MPEEGTPACSEAGLPDPLPMTEARVAQIGKALGHPARIRILEQFDQSGPHVVGEIVDECELAQSTISEHLRILREAGLLFTHKDGPRIWYCVRRSTLHAYARAIEELALKPVLMHRPR